MLRSLRLKLHGCDVLHTARFCALFSSRHESDACDGVIATGVSLSHSNITMQGGSLTTDAKDETDGTRLRPWAYPSANIPHIVFARHYSLYALVHLKFSLVASTLFLLPSPDEVQPWRHYRHILIALTCLSRLSRLSRLSPCGQSAIYKTQNHRRDGRAQPHTASREFTIAFPRCTVRSTSSPPPNSDCNGAFSAGGQP